MPKSFRTSRTLAVTVAVSLLGVSTTVLLAAAGGPSAKAAAAPGATVRASVPDEQNGPESDGRGYQQELSADGTAVAFTSRAQLDNLRNWVGDATFQAVYVRDLARNRTVMISRGQFVRPAPPSYPPITPPPTTTTAVIKYGADRPLDLSARGAQPTGEPELDFGETAPDGASYQPTISADGRYVAFVTEATNILEADDDEDHDILICDRDPDGDGDFDENKDDGERDYRYLKVTEPVLTGVEFPTRIDEVSKPRISDDASRIVWQDEVYTGDSTSSRAKTAVLRTVPGGPVTEPAEAQLVDGLFPGARRLYEQIDPDVSGDGRYIVFAGLYSVPDPESDGSHDVYAIVRNEAGTRTNVRVDLDVDLSPVSENHDVLTSHPAISGDGTELAFTAEAVNFEGPLRQPNVYVVRLDGRAAPVDSVIVSRDNTGALMNGSSPALSADGRFVAFVTDALGAHDGVDAAETRSCLRWNNTTYAGAPMLDLAGVPPHEDARDIRTTCQVVVRDLATDRERLQAEQKRLPGTLASNGVGECGESGSCAGNDDSTPFSGVPSPSLSLDGSAVAFDSNATNLVPDETDDNEATDVFVRTFRPELRADPDPLDFGDVIVDETFAQTVRFDHVGIGPLVVDSVQITGDDAASFVLGATTCVGEGIVLQQAGSCLVSVEFAPTEEGERSAVLHVVLPDEREFTVDLRGTGTLEPTTPDPDDPSGPARFAAGPDPLDFGERLPLSTGPRSTVTVVNRGGSPMTVGTVTVEPPVARAHFTVAANTCTAPLPAGGSCTVSVAFSPQQTTDLTGALQFMDDTPGAPHLVGLRGSGTEPAIELSPAVSPPGRVITVTGTGFAPGHRMVTTVPGAVQTGPVTVAADGTFRGGLLILSKATIGSFPVIAKVADAVTVNAQKQLLIVTPTVSPADFVVRG
ncbi:MAG: choice-of-anchor D domain-containing protein [Actinophytocola sp.]|uniref:choice-of-anchor D domain-containing protein n=1 Tax=Actinophytocola sp. TaxID=1872138 RepID=UPI0013271320|nr:choice-of-anchor D domain-containing protein [Actinophytocola sp.]MPZ85051.1 choice-of-anchor D domain-containing protein [Actinophytocola sp.]